MADFSSKSDAELSTLVQALPTSWYKRSHDAPDRDEFFKEAVLESVKRVLLYGNDATITPGSGTGLIVNKVGDFRRKIYKVTLTYLGLVAASTTADKTICTLPAKCKIVSIITDTTTKYIGGSVSAATIAVGIAAGNVDAFIEEHDVFSAVVVAGDLTNADLGSLLLGAATTPIQGGAVVWAATTAVSVRLVTTSADTDKLTQGSTTYYIVTEQF